MSFKFTKVLLPNKTKLIIKIHKMQFRKIERFEINRYIFTKHQ